MKFLGHMISKEGIQMAQEKYKPFPITRKHTGIAPLPGNGEQCWEVCVTQASQQNH